MVSCAVGLTVGVFIKAPFGWELPGSSAALVGALLGAAAAVGGALWAANAKQNKEDTRGDTLRRALAGMVASAIAPEIASALRNLAFFTCKMGEAIELADLNGDSLKVVVVLGKATVDIAMCERFIGQLDVFGSDAVDIVEAIGSMNDLNSSNPALAPLVEAHPWLETKDMVEQRVVLWGFYAGNLERALTTLKKYHHRGNNDDFWDALLGK